jgi:AmmeMemoRadiSam system protein B
MSTRPAAVAGAFYPGEADALGDTVSSLLAGVAAGPTAEPWIPKALILPHAGYVYSGPIAAFEVPTGSVALDRHLIDELLELPGTLISDQAHAMEHCLEVHLPFLQAVLDQFELVPIVVGQCPAAQVAGVLEAAWGGGETIIIVSSDLSHYHAYPTAQEIDAATTARILARASDLAGEEACGASAINGLMLAARGHDLTVHALDIRNSGDTAGDRRQVVGYGAFALS